MSINKSNDKKLCILFPGVGYTNDKPLMYYSKKLAESIGYDVICLTYKNLPEKIRGNLDKMKLTFEIASEQVDEQLKDVCWEDYSDILFIGKSIGTCLAAYFGAKNKNILKDIQTRYIYMTPLKQTFEFASEKSGISFHGTSDPWAETEEIVNACKSLDIPLYTYENANHSLETKDPLHNIQILEEVINTICKYIE